MAATLACNSLIDQLLKHIYIIVFPRDFVGDFLLGRFTVRHVIRHVECSACSIKWC